MSQKSSLPQPHPICLMSADGGHTLAVPAPRRYRNKAHLRYVGRRLDRLPRHLTVQNRGPITLSQVQPTTVELREHHGRPS
jgi:hypothetical protein